MPNPQDTTSAPKGKNYLLAIGVDHYQHWDPLHNAVKDIKDLAEVLTRQYQFEKDEVILLLDEDATEGKIYEKLRELKRKITPHDNLIIYYSGHGHYDEEFDEGYWVPVDARRDVEDRFISNSNIIKKVNAIDTHHTLVVVDSCFSGTLVVKKRSTIVDERFRSRRIIASGRTETVADGQPGENSPFAAGILTYLKRNVNKSVNTTSLIQYVKDYLYGKARQTPVEGRIQNSADEGGEFVFHLKLSEREFWENISKIDTLNAYENYLDYYPEGQFAEIANRRILELQEDDMWESAKVKNNAMAYENYLQKYIMTGKYVEEAKQRLTEIQQQAAGRRQELLRMAQEAEQRESIKKTYLEFIGEADRLFNGGKLLEARNKYRESLEYYMEPFAPKPDYVQEKINFCSNGITFLKYYNEGVKAMDSGNYRLALEYFNEARKIDHNPKMDELIKECRMRLKHKSTPNYVDFSQMGSPPPLPPDMEAKMEKMPNLPKTKKPKIARDPQPTTSAKKKKRRSSFGIRAFLIIALVAAVGLGVVAVIANMDATFPDPPASSANVYEQPSPTAPSNTPKIAGTWRVRDFSMNGVSMSQLGGEQTMFSANMTWQFNNNGYLYYTDNFGTRQTYQYFVSGNAITLRSGNYDNNGTIERLDNNSMRLSFAMPDYYGNTQRWVIDFYR